MARTVLLSGADSAPGRPGGVAGGEQLEGLGVDVAAAGHAGQAGQAGVGRGVGRPVTQRDGVRLTAGLGQADAGQHEGHGMFPPHHGLTLGPHHRVVTPPPAAPLLLVGAKSPAPEHQRAERHDLADEIIRDEITSLLVSE